MSAEHTYPAVVKMENRGWTVTVSGVSHKRHTLVGYGMTRDAAIMDLKRAIARLLRIQPRDVTLILSGDR